MPILLGAQTAGGAIGSVLAPSQIVVGASTAGMEGREGEVLGPLLGYCGVLMVVLSLIVVLAA